MKPFGIAFISLSMFLGQAGFVLGLYGLKMGFWVAVGLYFILSVLKYVQGSKTAQATKKTKASANIALKTVHNLATKIAEKTEVETVK